MDGKTSLGVILREPHGTEAHSVMEAIGVEHAILHAQFGGPAWRARKNGSKKVSKNSIDAIYAYESSHPWPCSLFIPSHLLEGEILKLPLLNYVLFLEVKEDQVEFAKLLVTKLLEERHVSRIGIVVPFDTLFKDAWLPDLFVLYPSQLLLCPVIGNGDPLEFALSLLMQESPDRTIPFLSAFSVSDLEKLPEILAEYSGTFPEVVFYNLHDLQELQRKEVVIEEKKEEEQDTSLAAEPTSTQRVKFLQRNAMRVVPSRNSPIRGTVLLDTFYTVVEETDGLMGERYGRLADLDLWVILSDTDGIYFEKETYHESNA